MNHLKLILLYTFSPSPMIKQTMLISPFAEINKPASGGEAPKPRQRIPGTVAPGNGAGKKEGRTGTPVALCLMDVYTM
jgi:hypothetical protein